MKACLELAAEAAGRTSPNPMVGALVVSEQGEIVSRAFHHKAGEPHAEAVALDMAGVQAAGAVLYVNLEPCCHHGKTPPCVEKIIVSGIKQVVAGMVDPNAHVSGGGIRALREAGIEVIVGVLERECRWLNRGFVKLHTKGLPWVCLKLASTLDGRIADRAGSSRWISGPEARQLVHQLRNRYDCVLVGGATAVKDNPELTVHDFSYGRNPVRAVVDTGLSLSPEARLCTGQGGPTIIFCSNEALVNKSQRYQHAVRLIATDLDKSCPSHLDLRQILSWLAAEEGITTVLCEGGARLAHGLISDGLVDEVQWFISPKILGDNHATCAIDGPKEVLLSECRQLCRVSSTQVGQDVLIQGILEEALWIETITG